MRFSANTKVRVGRNRCVSEYGISINPLFERIRLMYVAEMIASDDLVQNLRESGFCVDDDNKLAHLRAPKTSICIRIPQLAQIPQKN